VAQKSARSRGAFRIGSREFRSKEQAKAAIREVLYRYELGESTNETDREFLSDLLRLHPDAGRKIGAGIKQFQVRNNTGTRGFWVVRRDGTETDFSFLECLGASSHTQKVRDAMRHAIADQRDEFRNKVFAAGDATCAITGVLLAHDTCHVDHFDPTFEVLADEFAFGEGGYEAVEVVSEDGMIGSRLVDGRLQKSWQEFHRTRARLRLVTKEANLGLLRRGHGNRAA
jgi:hypothetical protein